MLVIGITGGSGSGKTTVVRRIKNSFSAAEITILSLDNYYRDNSLIPLVERANINFDHPDSIEFELFLQNVKLLKEGKIAEEPVYDYITSTRQKETVRIEGGQVVVIEGILLFTDKRVRDLCDIKVFVDADPDERLIRIIERDMRERGRNIQQVLDRYQVVKEMHIQFIEPTKRFADIILPQGGENIVAVNMLIDTIKQKLAKEVLS